MTQVGIIDDVDLGFKIITIYNFDQEHHYPPALSGGARPRAPTPTPPTHAFAFFYFATSLRHGGVPIEPHATFFSFFLFFS